MRRLLSFKAGIQSTARTARLAVGLLALALLAMNAAVALLLYNSSRTQQRLFEEGLLSSGSFIAGTLTRDATFFLEASFNPSTGTTDLELYPLYADLPSAAATLEALAATSSRGELVRVALVTLDGRILFDPTMDWDFGDSPSELALSDENRDRLRAGDVVLLPREEDLPDRHVVQAITDGDGRVVAALWLRSTLGPAPELEALAHRLTVAVLLTLLLVGLLWLMMTRLIRNSEAAEMEAARADRLRALGAATAGIAHEIRNPLGIMVLSIEEVRARMSDLSENDVRADLDQLVGDLEGETKRLRLLTDQFLEMARPSDESSEPIALAEVVEETGRLFAKGLPDNIRLAIDPMDNAVRVEIPAGKIRQILLNLLSNAQNAIADDAIGELRISMTATEREATLKVSDNGRGIPPELASQVFDPFFTTRSAGTGLGLALCRSIIESVGGRINLSSRPNEGTEVVVTLPRV